MEFICGYDRLNTRLYLIDINDTLYIADSKTKNNIKLSEEDLEIFSNWCLHKHKFYGYTYERIDYDFYDLIYTWDKEGEINNVCI